MSVFDELHRVVLSLRHDDATLEIWVRYQRGSDPEEAIDRLLDRLQTEPGTRVESVWAVADEEIVTYSCTSVGNYRRGEPIPRQRDRTP